MAGSPSRRDSASNTVSSSTTPSSSTDVVAESPIQRWPMRPTSAGNIAEGSPWPAAEMTSMARRSLSSATSWSPQLLRTCQTAASAAFTVTWTCSASQADCCEVAGQRAAPGKYAAADGSETPSVVTRSQASSPSSGQCEAMRSDSVAS